MICDDRASQAAVDTRVIDPITREEKVPGQISPDLERGREHSTARYTRWRILMHRANKMTGAGMGKVGRATQVRRF